MPSLWLVKELRIDHQATERSLNSANHDVSTNSLIHCFRIGQIQLIEQYLRETEIRNIGHLRTPLLSLGIMCGLLLLDLRCLLELGCSPSDSDTNGYTPMHLAVWSFKQKQMAFYDVFKLSGCSAGCPNIDRSQLIDLLLEFAKDPNEMFELIFTNLNKHRMSPFLLACASGGEILIRKLMDILDQLGKHVPISCLFDNEDRNVFHHLLYSFSGQTGPPSTKLLIRAKEKFPNVFLGWQDKDGRYPYQHFSFATLQLQAEHEGPFCFMPEVAQVRLLNKVISRGRYHRVEYYLRRGITVNSRPLPFESPLSAALHFQNGDQPSPNAQGIVEILLAFGADPTREFYLRCDEQGNAIPFHEAEHRRHLEMRGLKAHENLVEKVRSIRRSGILMQLTRLCRTVIRDRLRSGADEAIETLTCLPWFLREFLLFKRGLRLHTF